MKKSGFVYFFRQIDTPYVKIGFTCQETVHSRFTIFKMYAPSGAEIEGVIKTSNAADLEKNIHIELKSLRSKGEFFSITKDQVDAMVIKYDNQLRINARNKFENWLCDASDTEVIRISKLLNIREAPQQHDGRFKLVFDCVNKHFIGKYFTTTELQGMMADTIDTIEELPSIREIGITLKTVLVSMGRSENGKSRKVYFTPVEINAE